VDVLVVIEADVAQACEFAVAADSLLQNRALLGREASALSGQERCQHQPS